MVDKIFAFYLSKYFMHNQVGESNYQEYKHSDFYLIELFT